MGPDVPKAATFVSVHPQAPANADRKLCDRKVPPLLWVLFLRLTENKMGIRHVCWFQRETVTRFNAKHKQRRRGSAFAKGSPPHGHWRRPRPFDKEPQRWQGQSTATKSLCGSEGRETWPPQKHPGACEGSFSHWSLFTAGFFIFKSSYFARHRRL